MKGRYPPSKTAWRWLAAEPFRVFFALGVFASIAGTLLWPLFYAGFLPYHPALVHARLMIEGFAGALILGFLGTAVPRMLDAMPLRPWELLSCVALYLASMTAQLVQRISLGDGLFGCLLVVFLAILMIRRRASREKLPASFVMATAGVASGLIGAVLSAAAFTGALASPCGYRLGTLMLFQGFVLLPLLGAGSFLFPRFLPVRSSTVRASNLSSIPWIVYPATLLILASFVLEALEMPRLGAGLRFLTAAVFFARTTPVFTRTRTAGTLAFSLRTGVVCLLGGLAAGAIWPHYRTGMAHIFFIGGLAVLAFTVATRVSLGHSGHEKLFFAKLRPLRWILFLLLIGMATRVSADPLPHIMISHHIYAALLWIIAVGIWLVWILPKLLQPDPDT